MRKHTVNASGAGVMSAVKVLVTQAWGSMFKVPAPLQILSWHGGLLVISGQRTGTSEASCHYQTLGSALRSCLSKKRVKNDGRILSVLTLGLHMHTHIHKHTNTQTHTHTHTHTTCIHMRQNKNIPPSFAYDHLGHRQNLWRFDQCQRKLLCSYLPHIIIFWISINKILDKKCLFK
jgi:hypothetical protein